MYEIAPGLGQQVPEHNFVLTENAFCWWKKSGAE
jgi:hypothetical protein